MPVTVALPLIQIVPSFPNNSFALAKVFTALAGDVPSLVSFPDSPLRNTFERVPLVSLAIFDKSSMFEVSFFIFNAEVLSVSILSFEISFSVGLFTVSDSVSFSV